MPTFDVTLVTYDAFPDLTPDDQILKTALEVKGARARSGVWSDPSIDWSAAPLTVMRSTWDYFHRMAEFERWLALAGSQTRFVNSLETIRWNMHKRYLADLEERGIAVVPTRFLEAGGTCDLARLCRDLGWDDIVVKPAVSGSAFGAKRTTSRMIPTSGQHHLDALLSVRDVMVQPYRKAVETIGERALIYIAGEYSHGYIKTAFSAGAAGGERHERPIQASDREIAFGSFVLSVLETTPAYARVDLVPAGRGCELMELELIEPNLHFEFSQGAAERLADVLLASSMPSTSDP